MASDFSFCEAISASYKKQFHGRDDSSLQSFSGGQEKATTSLLRRPPSQRFFNTIKFWGDILFAFTGFLLFFPLLAVLSLLLFLTNRENPFFLQNRMGKNRKLFRIIKFKTMSGKRDLHGDLLPDEQRLTRLGKFLRKTSLDELPQLLNVLKGDMSLIGPRPWIPEQMSQFSLHEQTARCRVRPGITGLAQVYGRNGLTFRERLPYDIWYVRNQSLRIELIILWKTIGKVLRQDGIQQRTDALNNSGRFSQ